MPAIEAVKAAMTFDTERLGGRIGCGRRVAICVGALLSFALHGSVLASFVYWAEQKPGAIEQPTEAISLEFFKSEVLETVKPSPSVVAASLQSVEATSEVTESSAAPLIEANGAREEQLLRDVQVQAGEVAKSSSEAEGIDVLRGAFDHEINAEVEVAAEQNSKKARKATRHAPAEKAVKRSEPLTERMRLRQPKTKGAASARASIGAKQSTGRISASTGASMNYAAVVRARVAAHKPIGGGDRGTVVVAFGVSGTGALRSASIARSSGNPSLDGRVLAAVLSAGPFPPPPAGANLNFAIPFYFK